jgi:hypothetical protein
VTSFAVTVAAGSLAAPGDGTWQLPHRWTDGGVVVEASFTGAHLLHLAAAGCVLNDLYREASALGIALDGVRVAASGGFDDEWASTGISYEVQLASAASAGELDQLLALVDEVAEIPRALRASTTVTRTAAG